MGPFTPSAQETNLLYYTDICLHKPQENSVIYVSSK